MSAEGTAGGRRTAIVTGASRGLGRAIAERLLAEGNCVALVDLERTTLDATGESLQLRHGNRALAEPCDVVRASEVERTVARLMDRWGRIDVLVNNAGVSTCARVVDLPEDDWDLVMDVNAKGTFLFCKAVLPHMLAARRGAIVSIASQAGRRGEPLVAHYCAAKAAVINFTRALALEVAPDVRANVVCPGVLETEMIRAELRWRAEHLGDDPDTARAAWLEQIPLRRFQPPEQVAGVVAFLLSDAASEITGQAIGVDGGAVMT